MSDQNPSGQPPSASSPASDVKIPLDMLHYFLVGQGDLNGANPDLEGRLYTPIVWWQDAAATGSGAAGFYRLVWDAENHGFTLGQRYDGQRYGEDEAQNNAQSHDAPEHYVFILDRDLPADVSLTVPPSPPKNQNPEDETPKDESPDGQNASDVIFIRSGLTSSITISADPVSADPVLADQAVVVFEQGFTAPSMTPIMDASGALLALQITISSGPSQHDGGDSGGAVLTLTTPTVFQYQLGLSGAVLAMTPFHTQQKQGI